MQVVPSAVCLDGRLQTARAVLHQEPHMMSTPNNQPAPCVSAGISLRWAPGPSQVTTDIPCHASQSATSSRSTDIPSSR